MLSGVSTSPNHSAAIIAVVGGTTDLNQDGVRPGEGENERTDGVALSKQRSEQTDLRTDLHVRLGDGTDDFAVLQNDTNLVRFQRHLSLPGDVSVVHVVGDHGRVGSPSEMHALHLFVNPSMYMFLSRYMLRVRVNF